MDDIKDSLQITWSDTQTDNRVTNWIALGMVYINGKIGEEADYTVDSLPRTLLFEYVRYARDGSLDVFANNYLDLLLAARDEVQTAAAQEAQQ